MTDASIGMNGFTVRKIRTRILLL